MPEKAHDVGTTRRACISGRHERPGLSTQARPHRCLRRSATQHIVQHDRGGEAAIQALLHVYTYQIPVCFSIGVSIFFLSGVFYPLNPGDHVRPRSRFSFQFCVFEKLQAEIKLDVLPFARTMLVMVDESWAVCRLYVPPQHGIAYPSVRKCKELFGLNVNARTVLRT